jgi:hypothetical protein
VLKSHYRLAVALASVLVLAPTIVRGQGIIHNPPLPRPAPTRSALARPAPTRGAPARSVPARIAPARPASLAAPAARGLPSGQDLLRAQGVLRGSNSHAAPTVRTGHEPLNMVRDRPEELGQVPDHFFWLRRGLQAAQDPLDGDLVFITDQGRIAGRAALPSGFVIDRVVLDRTQIRLLDKTGRRQVSVARNIDASSVKSLQALPVMANREREIEVTRRGPRQLVLRDRRRSGARPLDVRAITAGTLAQAREIGARTATSRYVVSEEIVATVPSLQVRVFVNRFDRAGKLTGIAHIPIEGLEVVPHDFITIDDRGVVRALLPTAGGVKIREYKFSRPPRRRNGASEVQIKSLGRAIHEFAVPTNVQGGINGQRTFRKAGVRFEVKPPAPSISREQVVKNAQAYLTVDWVMEKQNYSNPAVENLCSPKKAKFWRRPSRFTSALVGKTIGPMPYRWGGGDTPETFKARIQIGALAGDVCTCRSAALDYCLVQGSAGVDCSGFVSRAWGIGKRGTSGLLDVATKLKSIADLQPGDAFDWPGHHVRLFIGMAPGPEVAFTVLEASTRLACEGVCERTYRPSEMNGFELIRYKGISG